MREFHEMKAEFHPMILNWHSYLVSSFDNHAMSCTETGFPLPLTLPTSTNATRCRTAKTHLNYLNLFPPEPLPYWWCSHVLPPINISLFY